MNSERQAQQTYWNAVDHLTDVAAELTEKRRRIEARMSAMVKALTDVAVASEQLIYVETGGVKSPNYMDVANPAMESMVESLKTVLSFVKNAENTALHWAARAEDGSTFHVSQEQLDALFAYIDAADTAMAQFELLFK